MKKRLSIIWRAIIGKSLEDLLEEHGKWADKTFPKGTSKGALLHAHRELAEISASMDNEETAHQLTVEYMDATFCIMDSARREGIDIVEMVNAGYQKLGINKKRKWKDNRDGSYSHIKGEELENVPMYIQMLAKTVEGIIKAEGNVATGEITKFKFSQGCKSTTKRGERVTGNTDGYSRIYVHIADDWFKEIGKWEEGPWSCQ